MTENFSQRRQHLGGFNPIDTLASQQEPSFQSRAPLNRLSPNTKWTDSIDTIDIGSLSMDSENERPKASNANREGVPKAALEADSSAGSDRWKAQHSQRPQMPNQLDLTDRTSHSASQRSSRENSIFNIPKPGKPRPEHHRAPPPVSAPTRKPPTVSYNTLAAKAQGPSSSGATDLQNFMEDYGPTLPNKHITSNPLANLSFQPRPQQQFNHSSSQQNQHERPAPIPLARPANPTSQTTYPASRPMFSSNTGFTAVNAFKQHTSAPRAVIDLTGPARDPDDLFNADRALAQDGFGSYDPLNYVDAERANENIKALLEGAFEEDEDDKPKRRLRKRKESPPKQNETSIAPSSGLKPDNMDTENKQEEPAQEQDEEEEDDGIVDGLRVKLLPHQIDGVAWMLDKEIGERKRNGVLPKGGILADDMGLGKTIQALSLILTNPRPSKETLAAQPKRKFPEDAGKGTLVVAPLALIKQWESEIKDKVTEDCKLKVLIHHGSSRTKRYEDLKKYNVVITTYQTLTSEHADSSPNDDGLKVGCFGVHWYRVILDEAHSIKNRSAKMTQAAYNLKSVYRWCLTGTPMQNNLDELQSLIRFLQIKPYADIKIWKDQIGAPMKNGRGGIAMKRLQYFLKAFMKRRTKEVLKKEGPLNFGKGHKEGGESAGFKIVARNVKTVEVSFSEIEQSFYDKLEARTQKNLVSMMDGEKTDYIGALVLLLRLRQTCNHPDLIRGNFRNETDSMAPVSAKLNADRIARTNDMDDIVNLFGGLSVETKKCDVCQAVLDKSEASAGKIRCPDCQQDLDEQQKASRRSKRKVEKSKTASSASNDQSEARQVEDVPEDYAGTDEDENCSTDKMSRLIPSAKINRLMKILDEESNEHKFIVFSEFTSMLDIVEPFLAEREFRFVRYDGKMRNDDREASLDSLRNDPKTRILLCSLRCGSLGLNLTAASRVVIMEPFWNPFVEEQAIDRVHRLNQTTDVTVYRLTVANSVEQRIIALQEKKRELAKQAIEGGKAVNKLSMKDIMQLFRWDPRDRMDDNHDFVDARQPSVLSSNWLSQPSVQESDPHFEEYRARHREKPTVQPSMQAKYDAAYARRW